MSKLLFLFDAMKLDVSFSFSMNHLTFGAFDSRIQPKQIYIVKKEKNKTKQQNATTIGRILAFQQLNGMK